MLSARRRGCLKLPQILGNQTRPFNTLSSLLKLCKEPPQLKQIHARFVVNGLTQNPAISTELVECYANYGHLSISERVYDAVVSKNLALCNAMIRNLSKLGEFERTIVVYKEMALDCVCPNEETCSLVLKSCLLLGDFRIGKRVHGVLAKAGLDSCGLVSYALAEMYRQSGDFGSSETFFGLEYWNSLISRAVHSGNGEQSLMLFRRMRMNGVEPNSVTVINLLRSSVELGSLRLGKSVHSMVLAGNMSEDLSVNTALLSMYAKFGALGHANTVFEKMPERDCVIWNVMISANSRNKLPIEALKLLRLMGRSGTRVDLFTALPVISSIAKLKDVILGKEMHAHVIRNCIDYQVSVHNSLIDMYCESGHLISATKIFDSVKSRDLVTWSAMIKGYVAHNRSADALYLFSEMKSEGVKPDFVTVINILPACVNIGALENVKYLHGCSMKSGLSSLSSLNTALLVSYAKCGCIEMARRLFDEEGAVGRKDVIAWNSMIGAYAKHGDSRRCFELYGRMKRSGTEPDQVTFLGVLTACVNSGLVEEGQRVFDEMRESRDSQPSHEHYACLVDLLGRAGRLNEARELVKSIPFEPDARVWGPLLSACKMTDTSETDLAEFAAKKLIKMEPKNSANYVLLSNIYATAGNWDGVARMRSALRDRGLRKIPGLSWLEISGRVHEFRVADRSHPKSNDIYAMLGYLELDIKGSTKKSWQNYRYQEEQMSCVLSV